MTSTTPDDATSPRGLPWYLSAWALCLALLPAGLGAHFILSDIYFTASPRIFWFVGSWTALALLTVLAAVVTGFRPISALISRSSVANAALIVLLALIAASLVTRDAGLGLRHVRSVILILMVVVGCAAFHLSRQWGAPFTRALVAALIAAPLLHLPILFWLYHLHGESPDFNWNHQLAGFTGVRPYNYMVEVGVALTLALAVGAGRARPAALLAAGVALAVLWASLFWAGGRGATMGLLGGLLVLTSVWRSRALSLWLTAVATAALGALLSLQVWTPASMSFGLVSAAARSVDGEPTSGRLDLWALGLSQVLERPLLGHGFAHPVPYGHLHNLPLNLLHAFGALGALAACVLALSLLHPLLSARSQLRAPPEQAMLLALLSLLAHGLVSGTYFHVHSQFYLALLTGTLVATATRPVAWPRRGGP